MTGTLFETGRLLARHLEHSDAAAMQTVYGDAEAMRLVDDGGAMTLEECRGWIEITHRNYERYGYGMTTIIEKATGEVVGFCGLVHPSGQEEAEIKYAFRRDRWGRGFATEAARAMIAYGREAFGLEYIIATIKPEHTASRRVLQKAGLRPLGTIDEADGSVTEVLAWGQKPDSSR